MGNHATRKPVVFAAMSKRSFYLREHIIKFILEQDCTPTSAFMMYSYFLLDTVDRGRLIEANNDLIRRSDELWVFGDISDGVCEEIKLATELALPIRFFILDHRTGMFEKIRKEEALFEKDCDKTLRSEIE